ncbi:MAG: beta-lactamase family protein [Deltaproteobacteria bacterium]|nr:beta-lactamase family protein [Deltaproteobacteria bacterium]
MKEIDDHFLKAIEDKVFPAASLIVFRGEEILYKNVYGTFSYDNCKKVDEGCLYDLASLTKPLVTSMLIAYLFQCNELRYEDEIGFFFREYKSVDKLGITVREMLCHRSGLPAHREYFKKIPQEKWGTQIARDEILGYALNEGITERGITLYSDIDFIILGYLIEVISTASLRDLYFEVFIKGLSLDNSDFCGNIRFKKEDRMLPVSDGFIGVDDENSRAMGGVAGHSGLFSNSAEIYLILNEIYKSYNDLDYRILKPQTMKELLRKSNDFLPGMFIGGFDTPLETGSQYGDYFTGETVAHLGFTGTSFVMDMNSGFGIILLTNRVCPDRNNFRIREFRRSIHNKLSKIFLKGKTDI